LIQSGFENVNQVSIDNVWNAIRFKKTEVAALPLPVKNGTSVSSVEVIEVSTVTATVEFEKNLVVPPAELEKIFKKHKEAREFFTSLSVAHQNEYVSYLEDSKKGETKQRRLESVVEKLTSRKNTPLEN